MQQDLKIIEDLVYRVFRSNSPIQWENRKTPQENRFCVIPGKNGYPRWIIPQDKGCSLTVLKQWRPYETKALLKWSLLLNLIQFGQVHNLPGVTTFGVENNMDSWKSLGWTKPAPPTPVIYVGTPSETTRLVIFLMDTEYKRCEAVVKIPVGPNAGLHNLREANNLEILQSLKPNLAPRLLYQDKASSIIVQQAVSGNPVGKSLTPSHINWLLKLQITGQQTSLKQQADTLAAAIEQSTWITHEAHCQLKPLLSLLNDPTPIQAVIVHGDFTPWNLKYNDSGELLAVDWENAKLEGLPLYDLIHFYFMQAVLFAKNTDIFPQMLKMPLIIEYMRQLQLDSSMMQKIFLFYLLDSWFLRRKDRDLPHAELYFQQLRRFAGSQV